MDADKELVKKINEYKSQISAMAKFIAENESSEDVFTRIDVAEAYSKMNDYTKRCERLAARIAGVDDDGVPTEEQLAIMDWTLSDSYDNE